MLVRTVSRGTDIAWALLASVVWAGGEEWAEQVGSKMKKISRSQN